eukprot:2218961-Pleurochrysis_carterae.AAC.1
MQAKAAQYVLLSRRGPARNHHVFRPFERSTPVRGLGSIQSPRVLDASLGPRVHAGHLVRTAGLHHLPNGCHSDQRSLRAGSLARSPLPFHAVVRLFPSTRWFAPFATRTDLQTALRTRLCPNAT